MGCDIHTVIERKIDDKWELYFVPELDTEAEERNYSFFSALCGVRAEKEEQDHYPKPNGWPRDVSNASKLWLIDTTRFAFDEEKDQKMTGRHSFSHCSLFEFIKKWFIVNSPGRISESLTKEEMSTLESVRQVFGIEKPYLKYPQNKITRFTYEVSEENIDLFRVVFCFDS